METNNWMSVLAVATLTLLFAIVFSPPILMKIIRAVRRRSPRPAGPAEPESQVQTDIRLAGPRVPRLDGVLKTHPTPTGGQRSEADQERSFRERYKRLDQE